jgi:hypothetical protein
MVCVLGCAAVAGVLAWAAFSRIAPMPVRVGLAVRGGTVPLGYQVSVFPAFGAFLGALALDVARRHDRRSWIPRALLVACTSLLALSRLAGALPLSGHALFLFAVLGYDLAPPTADRAAASAPASQAVVSLALVIPSLLVVGWCKLVVWQDPLWFSASAVLGLALGGMLARAARA